MKKFALSILAMLLISPLAGQGIQTRWGDSTITAYPMPKPAGLDSMWKYVQTCSGMPAVAGDIDHVVWFKTLWPVMPDTSYVLGKWTPPDTILISTLVLDSTGNVNSDTARTVVEHELLHFLVRGPIGPDNHPFWPFVIPCGLMGWNPRLIHIPPEFSP